MLGRDPIDAPRRSSAHFGDHRAILRHAVELIVGLTLLVSGLSKVMVAHAWWQKLFAQFGYPETLLMVTAGLELTGAALLIPRRSREYGAVFAVTVFVAATLSHLRFGAGLWALPALCLAIVAAWLLWANRTSGPNSSPPVPRGSSTAGSYPGRAARRFATS